MDKQGHTRRGPDSPRLRKAFGGLRYVTGEPDRPPVRPRFELGRFSGGTARGARDFDGRFITVMRVAGADK